MANRLFSYFIDIPTTLRIIMLFVILFGVGGCIPIHKSTKLPPIADYVPSNLFGTETEILMVVQRKASSGVIITGPAKNFSQKPYFYTADQLKELPTDSTFTSRSMVTYNVLLGGTVSGVTNHITRVCLILPNAQTISLYRNLHDFSLDWSLIAINQLSDAWREELIENLKNNENITASFFDTGATHKRFPCYMGQMEFSWSTESRNQVIDFLNSIGPIATNLPDKVEYRYDPKDGYYRDTNANLPSSDPCIPNLVCVRYHSNE